MCYFTRYASSSTNVQDAHGVASLLSLVAAMKMNQGVEVMWFQFSGCRKPRQDMNFKVTHQLCESFPQSVHVQGVVVFLSPPFPALLLPDAPTEEPPGEAGLALLCACADGPRTPLALPFWPFARKGPYCSQWEQQDAQSH